MRGLPDQNFAAFYAAEEALREQGLDVLNPARAFGGQQDLPREQYFRADLHQLLQADGVVVLPGWEQSDGARYEVETARRLGLPVVRLEQVVGALPPGTAYPGQASILDEAKALIHGNRQEAYGHPAENFTRTGRLWGALLGVDDLSPELVGLMMVAAKLARAAHDIACTRPVGRDNLVDGAGYLGAIELIQQVQEGVA
jgi:hypothetical protein